MVYDLKKILSTAQTSLEKIKPPVTNQGAIPENQVTNPNLTQPQKLQEDFNQPDENVTRNVASVIPQMPTPNATVQQTSNQQTIHPVGSETTIEKTPEQIQIDRNKVYTDEKLLRKQNQEINKLNSNLSIYST